MITPARVAAWVALLGAALFVVLAWWLVPWDPVPGGRVEPVPAEDLFSQAELEQAEGFSGWARAWGYTGMFVSLGAACWLAFARAARRLFERLRGPWWLRAGTAVALCSVVGVLVTLPMDIASQQLRRDYGLTLQSWPAYAGDVLLSLLVGVLITSLGVLVVIACARRFVRVWPAVAALLAGGLVVLGSFVFPVLIEPVFNDFEPLDDPALRQGVLRLADAEDVPVDEVLVADASRRTTALNAYVSGFGSTRRVVLYDTLVESLPRDQALNVVAHELAHAKHRDVVTGTALGAAGAVLGVGLLGLITGRLSRRGMPVVAEPQVVPVVLALVALGSLVASPVESGISRRIEARADVVAVQTTHRPGPFVAMQHRLARRSLADPTPPAVTQWLFGSHPTVLERVAIARRVASGE